MMACKFMQAFFPKHASQLKHLHGFLFCIQVVVLKIQAALEFRVESIAKSIQTIAVYARILPVQRNG